MSRTHVAEAIELHVLRFILVLQARPYPGEEVLPGLNPPPPKKKKMLSNSYKYKQLHTWWRSSGCTLKSLIHRNYFKVLSDS